MLGQHQRLIRPADDPADADPDLARHVATLAAWRRRSAEEQWLAFGSDDAPYLPALEPPRGRVRLGLFCPCLGLGGAEAWQLALAEALDPAAVVWRGAVVTEGRRSVAPAMLGALARRMPVGFGLEAARVLARECDVILSWSVLDHRALWRDLAAPPRVALACHFPGELPWTLAAEELLSRVDRLVAVSELAVESLPMRLRPRAQVIWNAVDGPRLAANTPAQATRAAWGLPARARVAGYLGRLAPEKDPAAMLRLAETLPDPWHVVIVGDGREGPTLAEAVARRGLDRVRLLPGTTAVGDVLAAFDALVVPSEFESFGLTMAEGFWTGVPVVSTRVGLAKLHPDLVRPVGFAPTGAELAAAILADHDTDRSAMETRVDRARTFARDRLALARFGREWTELVQDLARSSSDPEPAPKEERSCSPTRPSG